MACLGLPLWWLLGVMQLMFLLMAVPMGIQLHREWRRRGRLLMPRGFGVWLAFLGWLLAGLLVLQVDAPGSEPGGSAGRYLVFGYRMAWYLAATVACLWVLNLRGSEVAARAVRCIAWLFVVFVAGGVLGTLFPTISFPSLLQAVLPGGIATQGFVHDMTHVQVAQIQSVLGYDEARPSAPLAFTNDWGMVTTCTLPFFIAAWWNRGSRWRLAAVAVLAVAMWVVVASLNRGMWVATLAMFAFLVARSVMLGRVRLLAGAVAGLAVLVAVIALSPLGALVQARLDNPHSDEGRASLGTAAVASAAEGSPVVGFGSTRAVAGNFSSIAGGASTSCPHCTPPPLGTHGQLWHIIFVSGFVGAALFLWFLGGQLLMNLRARSPGSVAALCTVVTLIVTLPVYQSVGEALYIGSIGFGLLARESASRRTSLDDVLSPVLRHSRLLVCGVVIGALAGMAVHQVRGSQTTASQRVLVPVADLVGVPGVRPFSMDTEAAVATSDVVIDAASARLGADRSDVATALRMAAAPNTRVLIFHYLDRDPEAARQGVEAVVSSFIEQRAAMVTTAQESVQARYSRRQSELSDIYQEGIQVAQGGGLRAPSFWRTLTEVRRDADRTTDVLVGLSDVGEARAVSATAVTRSSDVRTVRVASGAALGGLLMLPLLWAADRRWPRLGRRPGQHGVTPLPVLGWVASDDPADVARITQSLQPLAGMLADPTDQRALALASLTDHCGDWRDDGSRVVLVVGAGASVGRIEKLSRDLEDVGLEAVGVIVAGRRSRAVSDPGVKEAG
ncbi:MAG: O-antigen ligase family protein [Actinomycetia bacterium]|nr:O-antigen ligase family protein [Actinomycetes bacterium]